MCPVCAIMHVDVALLLSERTIACACAPSLGTTTTWPLFDSLTLLLLILLLLLCELPFDLAGDWLDLGFTAPRPPLLPLPEPPLPEPLPVDLPEPEPEPEPLPSP